VGGSEVPGLGERARRAQSEGARKQTRTDTASEEGKNGCSARKVGGLGKSVRWGIDDDGRRVSMARGLSCTRVGGKGGRRRACRGQAISFLSGRLSAQQSTVGDGQA
jgi:hypothetical protein